MKLSLNHSTKYDSKQIAIILLLIVFTFKFSFILWQFADHNYLVAPGGDPLNHLKIVQQILTTGHPGSLDYPPLYHYLVAFIVKLTGLPILSVMLFFAFVLLFAPLLFLYRLTDELFGFWPAFWTLLLYMLTAASPLLAFGDGNYPDMLNYGVFIPLVFLYFIRTIKNNSAKNLILFLLFSGLMIMTHHLTTIFAILILLIYFALVGALLIFKKNRFASLFPHFTNTLLAFIGFVIVGFLLVRITFGPALMAAIHAAFSSQSPISNRSFSAPISYSDFAHTLPPIIEFIGALGLIYVMATFKERTPEKLLMIVWVAILWFLSRTQLSGLAPRYFREISVPLCILAGVFITYLINHAENNGQKMAFAGMFGFLIYTNLVQINIPPFQIADGGFSGMVWYRKEDKEKLTYFQKEIPYGVTVITNPSNPYLTYYLNENNPKHINFIMATDAPALSQKTALKDKKLKKISDYLNTKKASYIFIGALPGPSINESVYSEYAGYNTATAFLNQYEYSAREAIKTFADGSKLIMINE